MDRPLMIFDGDCGFCRVWIERWKALTGDRVDYAPSQSVGPNFPQIPAGGFARSVWLVAPDGSVSAGAEAVCRTLAYAPGQKWALWGYQKIPGVAWVSEAAYRVVAKNRPVFGALTRVLWGRDARPLEYTFTRRLFYRALALVYLAAFGSLWGQIVPLVGKNGILPVSLILDGLRQNVGFRPDIFPTLCWWNGSDFFLQLQCGLGLLLAGLLLAGLWPQRLSFLLWVLYLSLTVAGQDFLGFQWDNLLLEAGLIACLWRPGGSGGLWLLRFLLFKLMFLSGWVKWASDDPPWRHLTALTVHYQTQPLPNLVAWWAHHAPAWFHTLSCGVMFFVEGVVPFFVLFPRRPRRWAAFILMGLQGLIILTGNYAFFNLLALALCLSALDDSVLSYRHSRPPKKYSAAGARRNPVVSVLMAVLFCLSTLAFWAGLSGRAARWVWPALARVQAFRSVNNYGLFAVMTTERLEIIVEGSSDGQNWSAYEFKYKPGDLRRRPAQVAPHQPRLDWQMWFAALGSYQQNPWFVNFCVRLLQGEPAVLGLLDKNPFAAAPPRYVRAMIYEYRFTSIAERRAMGDYWKRELKGHYLPVLSLRKS